MFTTLGIGVISSVLAEVVTWLNKKLSGTVLHGDGAFLLAAVMAFVCALVQVVHDGIALTDWHAVWSAFAQIWAVAQIFFLVVVQKFNLDVQPNNG